MQSSSSLRGQMGIRSGPLAPTSAKLTTQYLVLDHMTNHYSKITKARPAIDNKPPRSIATSQKARDRKTRDHVVKTGVRPVSAGRTGRSRPHTAIGYYQEDNIYDENQWGEVDPDDEEGMLIQNIMRTTLRGNADINNSQAPYGSNTHQDPSGFDQYSRVTRQRPSSARSHRSMASGVSRTMVQTQPKKGTYDGDVLEKRSHVFTESKPFTPRTLKTDRKSRLSQYKCYNKVPPKESQTPSKSKRDDPVEVTQVEKTEAPVAQSRPQPKPRQQRLDQTREGPVTMNSLMFETLHSRDFSKYDKPGQDNADIPKLDISMDTDHLKWIKEQATKAKVRQNNDTLKSTLREEDPYDTSVDFGNTGEMSLTYGTLGSTKTRAPLGSSKKISPADEEALYVRFMKDVTNEVLDRGIYTDRALRQVFKSHIARNKGHLDELRMHQITDEIRQQLDIPRFDIDDETSLTMTKEMPPMQNGRDEHLEKYMNPDRYSKVKGQGHMDIELEAGMSGTLETSMKSRGSKMSTDQEQSADTYNFKSTEDDDLYSTIRSDMNTANLTDTQTLRTYQAKINEQEELEEGEIDMRGSSAMVTNGNDETQRKEGITVREMNGVGEADDEEDDDDEYDDDYEDDGDDEEDDVQHNTEQTATYRTDDDDF